METISDFLAAIQERVAKHDAKGRTDLYKEKTVQELEAWFIDEVREIKEALADNDKDQIQYEAVDVALMAMFIALRVA